VRSKEETAKENSRVNVSLPLLRAQQPDRPSFRLLESTPYDTHTSGPDQIAERRRLGRRNGERPCGYWDVTSSGLASVL